VSVRGRRRRPDGLRRRNPRPTAAQPPSSLPHPRTERGLSQLLRAAAHCEQLPPTADDRFAVADALCWTHSLFHSPQLVLSVAKMAQSAGQRHGCALWDAVFRQWMVSSTAEDPPTALRTCSEAVRSCAEALQTADAADVAAAAAVSAAVPRLCSAAAAAQRHVRRRFSRRVPVAAQRRSTDLRGIREGSTDGRGRCRYGTPSVRPQRCTTCWQTERRELFAAK